MASPSCGISTSFLEQRVRSDGERDLAAREVLERLACAAFAGTEPDSHAIGTSSPVEPRRELAVVLLGEDFGRRHERDLLAALDRLQRGERGDDRLAGAHVALQQALHRRRALQVVRDLAPHALLRARELEAGALDQVAS